MQMNSIYLHKATRDRRSVIEQLPIEHINRTKYMPLSPLKLHSIDQRAKQLWMYNTTSRKDAAQKDLKALQFANMIQRSSSFSLFTCLFCICLSAYVCVCVGVKWSNHRWKRPAHLCSLWKNCSLLEGLKQGQKSLEGLTCCFSLCSGFALHVILRETHLIKSFEWLEKVLQNRVCIWATVSLNLFAISFIRPE